MKNLFCGIVVIVAAFLCPSVESIMGKMLVMPHCKDILKRRHGDPVSIPHMKIGPFSEKYMFKQCMFGKYVEYFDTYILYAIGTYIAAHKYFVKDPRFEGEKITKPEMFKKFPSPEVDLDPEVKKMCEASATDCIEVVYRKARKSNIVQYLDNTGKTAPPKIGFETDFEAFVFRQTAMYYLCWYTMKRDPKLLLKYKRPPVNNDPNMRYDLDLSCLGYLYLASEIPESKRNAMIKSRDKSSVSDYRSTYDYMDKNPFQCAELWFCPDPCYPSEDLGGFNPKENMKQAGNPCKDLKNPRCEMVPEANVNFKDLVTNRFNVSCDCQSSKKGYFWSQQNNICEDINECEDQTLCSLGKKCVNTDGGYQCICPQGMIEDIRTTKCLVETQERTENKLPTKRPAKTAALGASGSVAFPADSSGSQGHVSSAEAKAENPSGSNKLVSIRGSNFQNVVESSVEGKIVPKATSSLGTNYLSSEEESGSEENAEYRPLSSNDINDMYEEAGLRYEEGDIVPGIPNGGMDANEDMNVRKKLQILQPNSRSPQKVQRKTEESSFISGFNVSCDCQSVKKGAEWNSEYNMCKDINECEDPDICSMGKQCTNTEGGYSCDCPPGTVENKLTTKCEGSPKTSGFEGAVESPRHEGTRESSGFGGGSAGDGGQILSLGSSDDSGGFMGLFSKATLISSVTGETYLLLSICFGIISYVNP